VRLALVLLALVAACRLAPSTQQRAIAIRAADGGQVVADLYGEKNGDAEGVVLVPGAVYGRDSWKPFATTLAASRHTVVAIDVRGGPGDTTPGATPDAAWEDVLAGARWLRRRGAERVAIVGASRGAVLAAEAAGHAQPGEIDRLVLLAPPSIPPYPPLPTLVVLAADEPFAAAIRTAYAALPEPKRLLELPGDAHAQRLFEGPEKGRLEEAIAQFVTPPR
jgi:pimeloyl-ACP methyl ester carboxylesterase